MQYNIARASPADASGIQSLYLELVNDPAIRVTPGQIGAIEKDESNFLLVAKLQESVIGTAFVTICRDVMYGDQPFAVLENLVVAEEYRRRGIGRSLLEDVRSRCKDLRCTKVMLLSSEKRKDAHEFFEQCGYRSDLKRAFVNYINRA